MDEFKQLLGQTEKKVNHLTLNTVKAKAGSNIVLPNAGSRTERNLSILPQYGAMIVKSNLEPKRPDQAKRLKY
jgi:hypothetical protein